MPIIIRPPIGLPPIDPTRPIPTIPRIPPGVPAPAGPDDLAPLRFRAETNPDGPAIDLVWELPDPKASPDSLPLVVLRRIRRFPGSSRRGVVPVQATAQDLGEGDLVYDTTTVDWDFEETREEVLRDGRASVERQIAYPGTPTGRVLVRTIRRERSPKGDVRRTTIRFVDRSALAPGTIYYYTAFVGPQRRFSRRTQASAIATGTDGPELVPLLPRIDRQRDTEVPNPTTVPVTEQGRGQLERLVRTVEAHSDMLLGFVKGLRDLHSVRRVDSRLLPAMAAQIGWELSDYLTEEGQRTEIAFAPDVQHTLGAPRNVARMVHRSTGWTVRVREFARNVALSWDGSRVERVDTGPAYLDASVRVQGTPPVLSSRTVPRGSVDTADVVAMTRLQTKAFDDEAVYSYDCGRLDPATGGYNRGEGTWFNRETIGLYATLPPGTTPASAQQVWSRVRVSLIDLLPLQVRPVLVAT